MKTTLRFLAAYLIAASCTPRRSSTPEILAAPSRRYSDLLAAAEHAKSPEAGALGSRQNPIKSRGPRGEREFLVRLRCPDARAPQFERVGSTEPGDDDHILDLYVVRCPAGEPTYLLLMDMYHDYREVSAVPPFAVLEYLPARLAKGCPPQVADLDSSVRYVFTEFEVDSPAVVLASIPSWINAPVNGYAQVQFVVDTLGRTETPGLMIQADSREAERLARGIVDTLQFRPAVHHAGCRVRQRVTGGFQFQRR